MVEIGQRLRQPTQLGGRAEQRGQMACRGVDLGAELLLDHLTVKEGPRLRGRPHIERPPLVRYERKAVTLARRRHGLDLIGADARVAHRAANAGGDGAPRGLRVELAGERGAVLPLDETVGAGAQGQEPPPLVEQTGANRRAAQVNGGDAACPSGGACRRSAS